MKDESANGSGHHYTVLISIIKQVQDEPKYKFNIIQYWLTLKCVKGDRTIIKQHCIILSYMYTENTPQFYMFKNILWYVT